MKIGDTIYLKEKANKKTGLIPCGEPFHTKQFPELAEVYEWRYNYPENVKWMTTPNTPPINNLIPHIIGKLTTQQ